MTGCGSNKVNVAISRSNNLRLSTIGISSDTKFTVNATANLTIGTFVNTEVPSSVQPVGKLIDATMKFDMDDLHVDSHIVRAGTTKIVQRHRTRDSRQAAEGSRCGREVAKPGPATGGKV